uniref:Centrosomal protein POC5 n=1 Tax=Electrophorus electricus TaxID=8005 RepID=A0A4W4E813_ELEEL
SGTTTPQFEGSRPQSQLSEAVPDHRVPLLLLSVNIVLSSGQEMIARSARESQRTTESDRYGQSSPDPMVTVMTEMSISEENLNKMENILETWSNNLKSNVMMELRKWRLALVEQHKLEMKKERERHAAHVAGINVEMDGLKDLLNTYQTSNQRKDEVIMNLTRAIDRQRERTELMRRFTHWRLQRCAAREEVSCGSKVAEQHYHLQLKRKVWVAWHSLIQTDWRETVERACRARAEEVCLQLSADYEAKLAEHVDALHRAQAEIQRLRAERERYEDSMKKAFMRGVCALNIEALSMFHTGGTGGQERGELHPVVCSILARPHALAQPLWTLQCHPAPPTAIQKSSARMVTAGQQKASKTVTARITGRSELTRMGRPPSSMQVMGVSPPMSSVIVERHHPVTQRTVSQATAAKFPRSALQSQTVSSTKSSSSQARGQTSAFHVHSIKVVD